MAAAVKVQRLTLRASQRDAIGRTVVAVEDAFRTASPAGTAASEVMLVRRLDLGVIRLGAPSQTLALRIEAALRGITPLRLRAGDMAPPDAPAICFPDQAEALAALLVAARRGTLRGWWWARLLPEAARTRALHVLVSAALAAAEREGGFALIAAMVRRLAEMSELDAILAEAPDEAISRALRLAGLTLAPQTASPVLFSVPDTGVESPIPAGVAAPRTLAMASRLAPIWHDAIRRSAAGGSSPDLHALFLTAAALWETFGPAAVRNAPSVLAAVVRKHVSSPAPPIAKPVAGVASLEQPLQHGAPRLAETPQGMERSESPDIASVEAVDVESKLSPYLWRSTRHAGLLFLIPAFSRLSLDTLDPTQGDLPLRLMRFLATRLRLRPDDAACAWLPEPLPEPAPARFVAPPAWAKLLDLDTLYTRRIGEPGRRALTDKQGRVLAGYVGPGDLGDVSWPLRRGPSLPAMDSEARLTAGLALAVSRLLRRHARISLRRLVRRPGLVRASATHLEVIINARFVDVDLRRAALDLDPGWVQWLGKIVRFEFDYGEDA